MSDEEQAKKRKTIVIEDDDEKQEIKQRDIVQLLMERVEDQCKDGKNAYKCLRVNCGEVVISTTRNGVCNAHSHLLRCYKGKKVASSLQTCKGRG